MSVQVETLQHDGEGRPVSDGHARPEAAAESMGLAGLAEWIRDPRGHFGRNSLTAKTTLLFAAVGLLIVFATTLAYVYHQRAEVDLEQVHTAEYMAFELVGLTTQGEDLLRDLTTPVESLEGGRAIAEHWVSDLNAMRPDGLIAAVLDSRHVKAFEYDIQRLEVALVDGFASEAQLDEFRSNVEMAVRRFIDGTQSTLIDLRRRHLVELETAKHKRQQLMIVFVLLCVSTFGAIGVAGGVFMLRLVKALAVLERRSQRIAAGDYGEPVPVTRNDEVGHLMEAINAMADKLARRDCEVASIRQASAQQEKMLALGSLAASIAHEVGNPIQAIIAICDQLSDSLRDVPCACRDTAQGQVGLIAEHTERLARIIDEVRNFARPGRPDIQRFDLNHVVHATLRLMRFEPRLARLKLSIELSDDALHVHGVRDHVIQVLMNLLINAADAVDPDNGRILVTTRKIGRHVMLSVSDNGPGIPENVRKAVFEPFFTTKPEGKGTGLGLSVCRSIVKDLGGQIEIVSAFGQGSTIVIRLPHSGCAA